MANTPTEEALAALGKVQNLGFVDFTTDLVKNVFTVVTDSAMDQMKAYAELVKEVSKPLTEYQNSVTGVNFADANVLSPTNTPVLDDYIKDVLRLDPTTDPIVLTDDQITSLESHFNDISINDGNTVLSISDVIDATQKTIIKANLQKFVYQKLSKGTKESYNMLTTVLKLGLNSVEIEKANLSTALMFSVDSTDQKNSTLSNVESRSKNWGVKGSASARWGWGKAKVSGHINSSQINVQVANQRMSSAVNVNANIMGRLSIDFRTRSFPGFEVTQ